MKKVLMTSTAAAAALAITSPVTAGNYISIFGGISMMDDHSQRIFETTKSFGSVTRTWTKGWTKTDTHYDYYGGGGNSYTSKGYSYAYVQWWSHTSGTSHSFTDIHLSVDTGFVIGAALGKELGNGLNVEVELAYRKHNVDLEATFYSYSHWSGYVYWRPWYYTRHHVTEAIGTKTPLYSMTYTNDFPGITKTQTESIGSIPKYTTIYYDWSGDWTSFAIMANVWFDLGANTGGMHPYIGGGLGWADAELDIGSFGSALSDSGFAYQFGIGVGFDMSNAGSRVNVEYRYFAIPDLEFDLGGELLDFDYKTSEIIVSYRIPF